MIERTIHYCWFGGNELPNSVVECINSWGKYCPDYKIVQWNETNYNFKKNQFMLDAYNDGKYAFVSDYARLDIIYNNGGIYLDTDVELIKNLDDLLSLDMYLGFELPGAINTGVGFGAKKNHPFILENLKQYDNLDYKINKETCVYYTGRAIEDYYSINILKRNEVITLKDLVVFPTEYFCPLNIESNKLTITKKTKSIHHYDASWYSQNIIMKYANKKLLPIKIKAKKYINNLFGEGTYEKLRPRK